MPASSAEIARRLALSSHDVCRRYLPKGKRIGGYWVAGDARGANGRSLFVRLDGPADGPGAAGRWTDAATGEHGDLLDLIAAACRLVDHRDARDEAQRFLGLTPRSERDAIQPTSADRTRAARRLFDEAAPMVGTLAETYLAARGITDGSDLDMLRCHPRCVYVSASGSRSTAPALVSAVTDEDGRIIGVQRTYLAPDGRAKAPLETPRKALGAVAGGAVRCGEAPRRLTVGEGVETVLSLRMAAPTMPVAATLSAGALGGFRIPRGVRRLYIAADRDRAGLAAAERLRVRACTEGVDARVLLPKRGDFNDDLVAEGREALARALSDALHPEDQHRLKASP